MLAALGWPSGAASGAPAAAAAAAGGAVRCEEALSRPSIFLLDSVTPPAAADAPLREGEQRELSACVERVLSRPADAMYCQQCQATYSLECS